MTLAGAERRSATGSVLSASVLVVVSGRRLLAEALCSVLGERDGDVSCRVAADDLELAALPSSEDRAAWLIDLDDSGAGLDAIDRLMPSTFVRRLGFYDAFSARHADAAFALRLTILFPLSSGTDHVSDLVFGDRRSSSATEAHGITRGELARLATLTTREVDVLRVLAEGLSVVAAARLLGITAHTVESHRRHIMAKLEVHQTRAVALAFESGLVTRP